MARPARLCADCGAPIGVRYLLVEVATAALFVCAGLSAAALFAGYLSLALVAPGATGFGDVKLSGVVGGVIAYLSWSAHSEPVRPFMIAGVLLVVFVAGYLHPV